MIEKMIDRLTGQMTLEQEFDPDSLTLTTTTYWGEKQLHSNVFDLEPMFVAFRDRMKDQK